MIGDASAAVLPVAGIFLLAFTAQILALGYILHFRRDDAAFRLVHLADVRAGFGAKRALDDLWEGRDSGRTVGTFQAIIFRLYRAGVIFLDVAAGHDQFAAELGQACHDIDVNIGIAIGHGVVVEANGRCPTFSTEGHTS